MKTFLKLLGFSFLYSLFFQLFYNWMRYFSPWPYDSIKEMVYSTGINLIPILFLCFLTYAIVFMMPWQRPAWLKILTDICFTAVGLSGMNLIFGMVTGYGVEWGGSVFNAMFILLALETWYYIVKYNHSILTEAMAKEEALRYSYEALKAQIDPHFLFNALNILSSLIVIDPQK